MFHSVENLIDPSILKNIHSLYCISSTHLLCHLGRSGAGDSGMQPFGSCL